MCRVGICSLSPSLASFHVSHMCSLLLFLNAEAKVKNECWLLFELGYRFLSLPEANLHGVQFSFFIFMLAQHFIFHFFAVCFQHFSEYIWRRHWLFSFSGSFHFSLFGMVGSEKRQFFFTFSLFFTLCYCFRCAFSWLKILYFQDRNWVTKRLLSQAFIRQHSGGSIVTVHVHVSWKPSTYSIESQRQFSKSRDGGIDRTCRQKTINLFRPVLKTIRSVQEGEVIAGVLVIVVEVLGKTSPIHADFQNLRFQNQR